MDPPPDQPTDPAHCADDDSERMPDLECAVCFGQFDNVFNTPKMLQCKHTFCLECLARMNVKSTQPDSLQCPLCRAYTALPELGLPKLDTDSAILSCLPETMQHVYSIRFNRNKGKLQVKRAPSSAPISLGQPRQSLDVGVPVTEDLEETTANQRGSFFSRMVQFPLCRAMLMISITLIMVSLAAGIVIILTRNSTKN